MELSSSVWIAVRRHPAIPVALATLMAVLLLGVTNHALIARWLSSLVVGMFLVWTISRMIGEARRGRFGLDVLAVVAMGATLAVGEHVASLIVMLALAAIWLGMVLSVALMLVAMTGAIPAVAGALIQELVDLATILSALRAVATPRSRRASASPEGPKARDAAAGFDTLDP